MANHNLDEVFRRMSIVLRLEAHIHNSSPEAAALWETVAEALTTYVGRKASNE